MNIHDLAVLSNYQGQGVGRSLLDAVQRVANEKGCCKLTLEVLERNVRARRLYESFGFQNYSLGDADVTHFLNKSTD